MVTSSTLFKASARTPSKPLRIHGAIARDLGVAIVSGFYRSGILLSNEVEASERLKVSRTSYREAIRILDAKGLVYSRPKVGTRVSALASWHLLDPDVLSWIVECEPNAILRANLSELRKIVEPAAAALAASCRTLENLSDLERALFGMAQNSPAIDAERAAERDFHSIIMRASGNAFLASLISGITAAMTWASVFKRRGDAVLHDPLSSHQQVYEAIKGKDAAAAHNAMQVLVDLDEHP
jgi:DNA-binding FadR family transcriptional regulator